MQEFLEWKFVFARGSLLSEARWTQSDDRSSLHGSAQTAAAYLGDSRESKKWLTSILRLNFWSNGRKEAKKRETN